MVNSLEEIKKLCKQFDITPRRDRGQNFLIDQEALSDIVAAAELTKEDVVLEIGPGFGVLTEALAVHVKEVTAIELDKKLVVALKKKFHEQKNIMIIQDDILQWWKNSFPVSPTCAKASAGKQFPSFKVVANLPYQITSHILRVMLESEHRPERIVVMVQKEVAERIVAKPGEMSLLSVMVQYYAVPEIVRIVPRSSFWPVPEVDSAIVRIKPRVITPPARGLRQLGPPSAPSYPKRGGDTDFFRFVKIGFASRRKQLQNNLSAGLKIPKKRVEEAIAAAGFPPKVRAQELSVDDWKRLINCFGIFSIF